jgi:serine protease Do
MRFRAVPLIAFPLAFFAFAPLGRAGDEDRAAPPLSRDVRALEARFREIAARAIPATVLVKSTLSDGSGRAGFGSGAIVSEDGFILTCAHVVEVASEVEVTLAHGDAYPARVLGKNGRQDYALLKIEAQGLTAFKLGDSSKVALGDWVVALGHPGGPYPDLRPAFTVGRVTGLHRRLPVQAMDRYYDDAIRTDAPIFAGNSGGPLLDLRGELIGINGAILLINENSYAVPIDEIKANLAALKAGVQLAGRAATFGRIGEFDEFEGDDLARFMGKTARRLLGREGIGRVLRGRGEAGEGLARALERFGRALEDGSYDRPLRDLFGNGGGNRSGAKGAAPAPAAAPRPYLGLTAAGAKAAEGVRGVLVADAEAGGPAALAGVQAGDVIIGLAGRPIARGEDLLRALASRKPGERVVLRVVRTEVHDGVALDREQDLFVTLGERKED